MEATYRFTFTDEHLITASLRYRQQIWWRRPFYLFKWILAIPLAALLGLAVMSGSVVAGGVLGAFLGALLLGWPIDRWIMRRRFQRSPFRNSDIAFTLGEQGAHVVGTNEDVRIGWPIYTKARRFKDGLLLFQGPHIFNWLPDSTAVETADIERAGELVREHVKDYRDV